MIGKGNILGWKKSRWKVGKRLNNNLNFNHLFFSVVINEPCNSNQQYRLGLNDYLYIAADGDKFIESSCGISLYAHDDKYQCSNLCFSVANYNLQTCDLQLAIYDSNVWKFGTNPSFVSTVHVKIN